MTAAKKTAKRAAPKRAAKKATKAPEAKTPEAPAPAAANENAGTPKFEPIMTVICGRLGKWGLHAQNSMVSVFQWNPLTGWQQSPMFPAKLAEFIPKFCDQHGGALSLEGYYTPQMAAMERQQAAAQQQQKQEGEQKEPPKPNRKSRRGAKASAKKAA